MIINLPGSSYCHQTKSLGRQHAKIILLNLAKNHRPVQANIKMEFFGRTSGSTKILAGLESAKIILLYSGKTEIKLGSGIRPELCRINTSWSDRNCCSFRLPEKKENADSFTVLKTAKIIIFDGIMGHLDLH